MKRFLVWLLLVLPCICAAQSNFLRGYVVTDAMDTLTGYVDYQGRSLTPSAVSFKRDPDARKKTYDLADCLAFGVDGKEHYERFTVNVSQAYTRTSNLREGLDTSFIRKPVFLKVLLRGRYLTLFSYTDEIKERFYLMGVGDKEPEELFRAQYLTRDSYTVKGDYRFRRQILKAMIRYGAEDKYERKELDLLRYDEPDLVKVIAAVNGQKLPKTTMSVTRWYAGAGLGVSRSDYDMNHVLASKDAVSRPSYMPMLSAGFEVFMDPAMGRTVLRLDVSLFSSRNKISKGTAIHSFNQNTVSLSPQFIYNFYVAPKLRLFAGAGGVLSYSAYNKNRSGRIFPASSTSEELFEAQDIRLEPFGISALGRIGAIVNRKIELSAGYILPAEITNYSAFKVRMRRTTFGINYLFGGY